MYYHISLGIFSEWQFRTFFGEACNRMLWSGEVEYHPEWSKWINNSSF